MDRYNTPHTDSQENGANLDLARVAYFDRFNDNTPKYEIKSFADLAAGLKHEAGEKDGRAISAGLFRGTRGNDNVAARGRIILDIESNKKTGEIPPRPEEASQRITEIGWNAAIYTSHSHTTDLPRYRVILEIDAPVYYSSEKEQHAIDLAVDLHAVNAVASRLGLDGVLDTTKRGPASLFFLPRCPAERLSESRVLITAGKPIVTGKLYDKARMLYEAEEAARLKQREAAKKEAAARAERRRQQGYTETGKLIEQLRQVMPSMSDWLAMNHYTYFKRTDRWLHPKSQSGIPGVHVWTGDDGVDRITSYHESDPLHHDAKAFGTGGHDVVDCEIATRWGVSDDDRRKGLHELAKQYGINNQRNADQGAAEESEAWAAGDKGNAEQPKAAPFKLMAFSSFVASLQPPDYLVDNIIQRGWLYSLTAMTGAGKTAVALDLAVRVASGKPLGVLETAQGRVVYLSGENPEDVKARCLMLSQQHGVTDPDIFFLEGAITLEEHIDALIAQIEELGGASFVIVDTSASYFGGEDDNSNVELGEYARLFRRICKMPSHPTVLVLAHPIKNASKTNLLPRGGGAFLNEVDGNLTLWTEDKELTTLHWQGKFRGPEFEPIQFRLKLVKHPDFRDARGREMPSVIALPVDFTQAEKIEEENYKQEDRVLLSFSDNPAVTQRQRARMLGFVGDNGLPKVSMLNRILVRLEAAKLLIKNRKNQYALTAAGQREVDVLRGDHPGKKKAKEAAEQTKETGRTAKNSTAGTAENGSENVEQ